MPIYAYRCEACGHAKDVLQKLSDAALTTCPVCGADSFRKQVTAAGFQLKGSGWYATDFKGKPGPAKPAGGAEAAPAAESQPADVKSGEAKPADAKPAGDSGGGSTPSGGGTSTAAAASACGTGCACH